MIYGLTTCTMYVYMYMYMNNHVHRVPFSDIHVERKKEVAKSKE